MGIGHVRYSTAGGKGAVECQPFVAHTLHGQVALAHNGQVRFSTALFAQSSFSVAHLIFVLGSQHVCSMHTNSFVCAGRY